MARPPRLSEWPHIAQAEDTLTEGGAEPVGDVPPARAELSEQVV